MDWMYSEEGSTIGSYGKEGVSFVYNEKGEPEFIDDYIMQFKGASPSTYYAAFADMGVGPLAFAPYTRNIQTQEEILKITGEWSDIQEEYWSIIANDEAYKEPYIDPALTVEETEEVANILTDINTMLEQEYDKYIMGVEEISNWDKVIEKCKSLGSERIEEIYNGANAR